MALKDNLVAHWSLEAASGPRVDDIGGNTLTDVNTVTGNPGKVGNAAQFTSANSEYLTIPDNPALSMGDIDFTIAFWVYFDTLTASSFLCKWSDQTNQRAYRIDQSGGTYMFFVSSNGTNFPGVNLAGGVAATWQFVVAWHDSVANTINIQLNNGTPASLSHSLGVFDNTANFDLGTTRNSAGTPINFLNGRLDEVGIWKRVLTAPERTSLYNSGNGLPFSSYSGTYTLSGSGTAQAATGSGAGLTFLMPTFTLSGTGQAQNATGSGAGLTNTAPVYSLSGIGSAQPATGSGTGLVNTNPLYSLSGAGQADAATGSGVGLIWIPDVIPVTIVVARARPLMVAGVARPLHFTGVAQ